MVGCIKIRNLFTLSAGSKKCTRDVGVVTAVVMGSKKYTRDVSEVTTMFAGSKKYTRDVVGYSLRLQVQKNIPATMLVATRVYGFKKMHPRTGLNGCV